MASRRNSRYHIIMFVCSRYIITVCTSIRATSLYTEDEGERRWLPEGIPGITLLRLSVVVLQPDRINPLPTDLLRQIKETLGKLLTGHPRFLLRRSFLGRTTKIL